MATRIFRDGIVYCLVRHRRQGLLSTVSSRLVQSDGRRLQLPIPPSVSSSALFDLYRDEWWQVGLSDDLPIQTEMRPLCYKTWIDIVQYSPKAYYMDTTTTMYVYYFESIELGISSSVNSRFSRSSRVHTCGTLRKPFKSYWCFSTRSFVNLSYKPSGMTGFRYMIQQYSRLGYPIIVYEYSSSTSRIRYGILTGHKGDTFQRPESSLLSPWIHPFCGSDLRGDLMGSSLLYLKSIFTSKRFLSGIRVYTSTALEQVVSKTVGLTPITNQVPMNFSVTQCAAWFRGGRCEEDEAEFPILLSSWGCGNKVIKEMGTEETDIALNVSSDVEGIMARSRKLKNRVLFLACNQQRLSTQWLCFLGCSMMMESSFCCSGMVSLARENNHTSQRVVSSSHHHRHHHPIIRMEEYLPSRMCKYYYILLYQEWRARDSKNSATDMTWSKKLQSPDTLIIFFQRCVLSPIRRVGEEKTIVQQNIERKAVWRQRKICANPQNNSVFTKSISCHPLLSWQQHGNGWIERLSP